MASRFGGIPVDQVSSKFGGVPVDSPISTKSQRSVSDQTFKGVSGGKKVEPLSFMETLTGRDRTTPETEATPEISKLGTGNFQRDLKISLGVLATSDPKSQIDIIKKAAPDAKINTDNLGNTFIDFGGGNKFILNKPGLSEIDIIRTVGQIIQFIPAGKLVSSIKTTLPRIFAGAGVAGATELGLQTTAKSLGAEDPFSLQSIGEASLLGGASEVVAPAIQAMKLAKQRKAVGTSIPSDIVEPSVKGAVEAQEGLLKATGVEVPLFPGQKTQLPTVLEKQAFAAQLPEGTRKATIGLQKQNQSAADAVNNFLQELAPPESIITGPKRFRTAAQRYIDSIENIRKEKVSPIYTESFKNKNKIPIGTVMDLIDTKISEFPQGGQVNKTMKRIATFLKGDATIKKLHNAKLEIDQLIDRFGDNSLGKTTKKETIEIKNALLEAMDKANPLYKSARDAFIESSPDVIKANESIVGKIATIPENRIKTISKQIFDPAETNPDIIKNAKKAIETQDPEAWDQLLRAEIERRMGSMKANISELQLTTENIPGQLHRAIFGNQQQRKVLFNAVDGEVKKNMQYLETVLKRASLGRVTGSQTAIREEIKKELRGSSGVIRDFFKSPIDTLVSAGEDSMFDRNVRVMADLVFNPEWKPKLKQLRKIKTSNPASARAMSQLIKEVEESLRD